MNNRAPAIKIFVVYCLLLEDDVMKPKACCICARYKNPSKVSRFEFPDITSSESPSWWPDVEAGDGASWAEMKVSWKKKMDVLLSTEQCLDNFLHVAERLRCAEEKAISQTESELFWLRRVQQWSNDVAAWVTTHAVVSPYASCKRWLLHVEAGHTLQQSTTYLSELRIFHLRTKANDAVLCDGEWHVGRPAAPTTGKPFVDRAQGHRAIAHVYISKKIIC